MRPLQKTMMQNLDLLVFGRVDGRPDDAVFRSSKRRARGKGKERELVVLVSEMSYKPRVI